MKPLLRLFALGCVLLSGNAWAAQRILLTHVTLIDGTGSDPYPGTSLLIEDGKIAKILPYGSEQPQADKIINLQGRYVMPGLVDSHYHLIPGVRTAEEDARYRRFALLGGVTAVRDMGGDGAALKDLAARAESASDPSPRIFFSAFFAGPTWFANDERVKILMHGRPKGEAPWARQIKPDTNIAAAVAEAKSAGATGVKIYADLTPPQIAGIAKEAKRQGLKVWSHATVFPAKPSDAVNAGVETLSHGNLAVWEAVDQLPAISDQATNSMVGWEAQSIDDPRIVKLLEAMKSRGTMLDDTLIHTKTKLKPAIAKTNAARADAIERWVIAFVRRANEMGIVIAAGTDFPESPDDHLYPNIHDEMAILVSDAGLKPLQAIRAATLNGAKVLGQEASFGTVAEGKRADIMVIKGDPRRDMANTRNIEWVMKGGIIYMPDERTSAPKPN